MTKITKPGIYTDIAPEDYFADPCAEPSLTESIAKILLDKSPLHAWHAHPRLNPDYRPDNDKKFDVGNIAHALLLGRGKAITVLDYDDWRTKAAREAREAFAVDGKLAVLGKHYALASRMVEAAREQLAIRGLDAAFRGGHSEAVIAWKEGDLWFRSMVDWILNPTIYDYKTTQLSCAPHAIPPMMVNAGWDIQAAMIERGLDAIDPDNAGRRVFRFVAQETDPPYCLMVCELTEAVLCMGRKRLAFAIDRWSHCIVEGRWPGYPTDLFHPEYPAWSEARWLEREIEYSEHGENELSRRKDEGEPLGGYARAVHNLLNAG